METTDCELVKKCKAGDRQAFDELYMRHRRQVFTLARFLLRSEDEAADVTQEAFLRAWKALPSLRAEETFGTWIYRITWNRCQDYLKKKKHYSLDELGELPEPVDSAGSPEKQFSTQETREVVRRAIESLSPEHRAVVVMHHVEGLPVAQISQVLATSTGTVMSRLYRAREILRRKLASHVEPEVRA